MPIDTIKHDVCPSAQGLVAQRVLADPEKKSSFAAGAKAVELGSFSSCFLFSFSSEWGATIHEAAEVMTAPRTPDSSPSIAGPRTISAQKTQ